MTASKAAKAAGLDSLKELTEMSKQSSQTLTNWYNNKPELFDLIVKGAVIQKKQDTVHRFDTLGEPSKQVEVSDLFITINQEKAYTHKAFLVGMIDGLTAADEQRIHKAIRSFDIFVGDL